MSQTQLARQTKIAQGQLSKFENGLSVPSEEMIEELSLALRFPVTFFNQSDSLSGLPLSMHSPHHRKRASVGKKDMAAIHSHLNVRLMHLRRLLEAVELESSLEFPRLELEEYGGDIEYVAQVVRNAWNLPPGPIDNLTEAAESAGAIVVHCDFAGVSVDGVSFQLPGLPPLVFLNRTQPADRMRFTLAHELGHLILHRYAKENIEDEANDFASAFLMPGRDIRSQLIGRIDLARLAQLKPIWKVSMSSILMKANRLELLSYNQQRHLWMRLSKEGYRRREPPELDFPVEQPTLLPTIFRLHLQDLAYSIQDLSEFLHISESEFREMYNVKREKPKLRVVR